jgi:hypothetical protein
MKSSRTAAKKAPRICASVDPSARRSWPAGLFFYLRDVISPGQDPAARFIRDRDIFYQAFFHSMFPASISVGKGCPICLWPSKSAYMRSIS